MTSSCRAMVASGHPLVSRAAATILRQGGNAFDAAVGAGFAGAMAEPALTSPGGGGFLLARTAGGESTLFDFFVDTPGRGRAASELTPHFFPVTVRFSGSDQQFHVGPGSVAVPGNLKGFLHVHERLGRLPLAQVVRPAVTLAREGLVVNSQQGYFLGLLEPIMTLSAAGRALFAPGGAYIAAGDRFYNHDLADFLEQLGDDGGDNLYGGALAARIDGDMQAMEGLLTREDLAVYRVMERPPLEVAYRGRTLLTNPPPSFGGALIAMALRLLDRQDLSSIPWGSPRHLTTLAATMIEVEQQRSLARAESDETMENWSTAAAGRLRTFSRGTTHVSVVDMEGNVAAMTTSNGEGSGYIVPGSGIMLNNMMGEDDLHPEGFHATPPGQRVASMMSPSILLGKDSVVELILGSGGSKRIRTAIIQVLSNVVDFGLDIGAAVAAPRLHWDDTTLQVEPGLPAATVASLKAHWPVNVWKETEVYFGGVHAVAPGVGGAGDPRRGGHHLTV
ncbi:MAG: gamma-glutamyltransferase [Desulfobulbaceae bacterium]|nr:gamma-glutamyltransferase [Desulfobulbaceae bacterium]